MSLTTKDAIVKQYAEDLTGARMYNQYVFLGFHTETHPAIPPNEPLLINVSAPASNFICGSQGSGKTYTLDCILENCIIVDERIGQASKPLAGLPFYYDPDAAGDVVEAAYLCSIKIPINVLIS
jgi:hypothetical protein